MKVEKLHPSRSYTPNGNITDGMHVTIKEAYDNNGNIKKEYVYGEIKVISKYETVPFETTKKVFNEDMRGTTLRHPSDLKNYYVDIPVASTKQIIVNQSSIDFIRSLHLQKSFSIAYNNITYSVNFLDNNLYINDDGSFSRKIRAIPKIYKKTTYGRTSSKTITSNKPSSENINKMTQQILKKTSSEGTTFRTVISKGLESKNPLEKYYHNVYIKKTNKKYSNLLDAYYSSDSVLRYLQLIKSTNDHIAHDHPISDFTIEIAYYDKNLKSVSTFKATVHYCAKCKKYFDYYHSFLNQLDAAKISKNDLLITLISEHGNELEFEKISYYMREHSKLNLCGYSAGKNGLDTTYRRVLIDRLIDEKIMSASEIKRHLNYLINRSQDFDRLIYALEDWNNDINYINHQIQLGRYK